MNRRHFTFLCAAASLGIASGQEPAPAPAAAPPLKLRVLCFNLRYANKNDTGPKNWDARRAIAADVITRDQPDVIGFQEALRLMLDDLKERIPGYEEIGVGRDDGKELGEYSAIWVKKDRFAVEESGTFWLSDTPEAIGSKSWGNEVVRVCTWARLKDKTTGRDFHFYNTHLDHQSQPAREKGAALIAERLAALQPAGPFLLTGDFNAGEDNPAITALKKGPLQLVDTWRALHPGVPAPEANTFHNFTGSRTGAKIDYIFAPPSATPLDAAIMYDEKDGVYPSDHYPVRATVEFPG